ncbi:MAG: ribonuclease R [Bacteroidales bacterium]|nr:ribonuclease R [Bacteroidales bacterium]MBR6162247.1 ribonuclease R [Bacteroidales bacterium]
MEDLSKKIIDALMQGKNEKLNYKQIAAKVGVYDKKGREQVKEQIERLIEAKLLLKAGRGKYRLNYKQLKGKERGRNIVTGKIEMKRSGMAFVIPQYDRNETHDESLEEDIFIADGNLGNALNNDIVRVSIFPSRKGKRREGQVVEVVQRSKKQLVGTIQVKKGVAYFIPDNAFFRRDIIIPGRLLKKAKSGDKVVVVIVDWPAGTRSPLGEVTHVLGQPGNNNVEMLSILAENDFPLAFPRNVEEEAAAIPKQIAEKEILRRRDFRSVTTFTIDPADAKDFDDALSFEQLSEGLYRVGIHIADVSYYVRPGTALDAEAYHRATSVYLVDRTIPMLPEALSNNLCSLNPGADKLCYSAVFDIDDHAKVHKEWFGHTVINSNRRFNYEEAQEIIETKQGDLADIILKLNDLASIMRKQRFDNNAINFETEEVKFKLDENSHPIGVYLKVQKEANWLIEEFMLLANRRVAEKIGRKRTGNKEPNTFVYRIHDKPLDEKLNTFKTFVKKLGFDLKTSSTKAFRGSLNQMLADEKGKSDYDMLSKLSIRIMARACYSTENIGHYGLAFPFYTHFTSPIRRYPDLMVHRLLDHYLANKESVNKDQFEEYCKHCSMMEQQATQAERDSVKYKQAEFLMDKVGQVFEATVSGISKWGIYAELKESKCEGMIPMRSFDDDFYYIDEENYTLVGLHHGHSLRFGDSIKVRVVAVDMIKRQMDFQIVR